MSNSLFEKVAARYRVELSQAAQQRALLIEEIAHLEAYAEQLSNQLADVQAGREQVQESPPDAWGDQPNERV